MVGTLQLLGHGATVAQSAGQQALTAGADGLALLLPHLDRFTRSDWLVYHDGGAADLLAIAVQTAIYVALMAAAGLFDLYRKQI